MPARRDKTAQRAWQGSPVAKRRPQNRNGNRQHRNDGQQHHRNLPELLILQKVKDKLHRPRQQLSSGAAAAVGGAEGDAHGEDKR